MMGKLKEFFLRREITKFVKEQGWITGAFAWLNAAPGRKRGLAALLLGASAALKYLGHVALADHADHAAQVIEQIGPGLDIVGLIMMVIGFGHTVVRPTAGVLPEAKD